MYITISTKTCSLEGGADRGATATIHPNEHYTLYTIVKVSKSSKRPTKNYLEILILIFVYVVTYKLTYLTLESPRAGRGGSSVKG